MVDEHMDPPMRIMIALWYSNFRNLEVRENGNVWVVAPRFSDNALRLMLDLAETYNCELIVYPTSTTLELDMLRAMFIPKEVGNVD